MNKSPLCTALSIMMISVEVSSFTVPVPVAVSPVVTFCIPVPVVQNPHTRLFFCSPDPITFATIWLDDRWAISKWSLNGLFSTLRRSIRRPVWHLILHNPNRGSRSSPLLTKWVQHHTLLQADFDVISTDRVSLTLTTCSYRLEDRETEWELLLLHCILFFFCCCKNTWNWKLELEFNFCRPTILGSQNRKRKKGKEKKTKKIMWWEKEVRINSGRPKPYNFLVRAPWTCTSATVPSTVEAFWSFDTVLHSWASASIWMLYIIARREIGIIENYLSCLRRGAEATWLSQIKKTCGHRLFTNLSDDFIPCQPILLYSDTLAKISVVLATALKLASPELYTGHCSDKWPVKSSFGERRTRFQQCPVYFSGDGKFIAVANTKPIDIAGNQTFSRSFVWQNLTVNFFEKQ